MVVAGDDGLSPKHQPFLERLRVLKIDYCFKSEPGAGHNLGRMKDLHGLETVRFPDQHYVKVRAEI